MEHLFAIKYAWLIPLLPLIGAAIAGLFGARLLKGRSHWPIWLGVGASAVISGLMLFQVWGALHHVKWERHYRVPGGEIKAEQHVGPYTLPEPEHKETADGTRQSGMQPAESGSMAAAGLKFGAQVSLWTWIKAGNLKIDAGFWIDPLTCVMMCVVTGIGFLITVFSAGYMKGEKGYFRFFAYLGLFIFMMSILVMGDNLVMLYLGWEGVGLCSYLLIGYYYEKPAAREAAKKAFLVNRIGDFGFGLGIMLIYVTFGTVSYFVTPDGGPGVLVQAITPAQSAWEHTARQWIPFLLMLGAFGKSAQFPLYVWLPDAMEGPTPVSALIHAATMVTAGVYMIVRCGTLFVSVPAAMWTIAIVGAFTAIFAASIALRQFDLKKVFAYSTISQLGFMFVAVGVLAPVAGVFHLVTHAFFKALLFLSSGVVMHAMLGHLDMRRMSGLKRVLPWTNILMLIGCLALAGFPFFSGFFSKDEIVAYTWERSPILGVVMLITAFMTAYYTFRLYFRVFQGPEVIPAEPAEGHHAADHDAADAHDQEHHGHHNHEPGMMILPLVVLAIGAVFAGYLNFNWRAEYLGEFLKNSPSLIYAHEVAARQNPASREVKGHRVPPTAFGFEEQDAALKKVMHEQHRQMMIISGIVAMLGIYVAYLLHLKYRDRGDALPARFPQVSRLLEAKYWVDEVYQAGIVEPLRTIGRLFWLADDWIVDGVVKLLGFAPQAMGFGLKLTVQRGSLQGYGLAMLVMIAAIMLVWFAV